MPPPPPCLCLTGPTACGKSSLALQLARELPVELISVDSAMVYRGMDIGTAKPTAAELASVPHHLVDVADPAEPYSAGRFLADATAAIAQVRARGRVPLLVGGTLLYLRALRHGLSPLPQADPALRAEIDAAAERAGWPALHQELALVDPAAAARIAVHDRQRIQRALEVYRLTGEPLSALQRRHGRESALPMAAVALVPPDRERHRFRVAERFDAMVESGLVEEVRELLARGDLSLAAPALRAVGYRQVGGFLVGEYPWDTARRLAITATRQLAKRQMTWLRSESGLERHEAFHPDLPAAVLRRFRDAIGV